MVVPARVRIRALLATQLLAVSLVIPVHAAVPHVAGQRSAIATRIARTRPALRLVPGKPTRFPRELLPSLLLDMGAEIQEPGEEPAKDPRDLGLSSLNSHRPPAGTNRLINDPSGDPPGATQSENTIAAHGQQLVAGWNDSYDPSVPFGVSGYGYSGDGGRTWTDGGILPHASSVDVTFGDPSLTVDGDGNFYYSSLYAPDGIVDPENITLGVSVHRGRFRDGKFSFGTPVLAAAAGDDAGLDKEWIAADPQNGNLYVTYTRFFLTGATQIELVRSTDHGRTWSPPLVLTDSTSEAPHGSRPAVGPRHEVYVVYTVVDLSDFSYHMRIRKSAHFGRSFGKGIDIGENRRDHGIYPNVVTGPPGFNRPGGVEFPSIAIDRSDGRSGGDVCVVWPEAVDYFDDGIGGDGVQSEVESNDTPATATSFPLGVTLTGSLSSTSDADWYSFSGRAGQTVEFYLVPAAGVETEGFLRLYCRGGEVGDRLAYSYLGGGQAFIVFTLPADGTYSLRVLPINPFATLGDYDVFTGAHVANPLDRARDSRDVMLSRSRDGVHWTRRQVVNHEPARFDDAFPEVAIDGRGKTHVIWYDHRNDTACGISTDVYASRSSEGDDFEPDTRVNDGPATNWNLVPSRIVPNMGDYIAITADQGSVYANWADGRLGSPDSWMAELGGDVRPAPVAGSANALAAAVDLSPQGPIELGVTNPARRGTAIPLSFDLPRSGAAKLEIFAVTGQRVQTLLDGERPAGTQRVSWDTRGRDGATVAPGVYFVVLRTTGASLTRGLVLLDP